MDSTPLLPSDTVSGAVDYRNRPVRRSSSGGWTSAFFIIGVEVAERFAYYGVSSNLITYLTGPMGESTAVAAANVNVWMGFASMLPLPLGFAADWWFGRYRTIVGASILYLIGLGMLIVSAAAPAFRPPNCTPCDFQVTLFFSAIYVISIAQGGHKPCVQAFGADQFDEDDPEECNSKSSFFNWWYFGMCFGTSFTVVIIYYVQENISWGAGFGISLLSMGCALIVFLLGTKNYRFYVSNNKTTFSKSSKNGDDNISPTLDENVEVNESRLEANKILHDERLGAILKLFPLWATCLVYAVVFAQLSTFFTKQGSTMDRRIGPSFLVPPAALMSFMNISVVTFIPIYDRVIVPISRKFSGVTSGLTLLQRIGTGIVVSTVSMLVAALVEKKRLQTAKDFGLIDSPEIPIPMSLWWLVPQYIIFGVSDVFTIVGLQEFFYSQVPDRFRSLGMALYLSIFGIGSFISSALVFAIDRASRKSGDSWFPDNLNRGHLDYFYWLLAGLSAAQLLLYLACSRCYVYKKESPTI